LATAEVIGVEVMMSAWLAVFSIGTVQPAIKTAKTNREKINRTVFLFIDKFIFKLLSINIFYFSKLVIFV